MPVATTWMARRARRSIGSDGASLALGAEVSYQAWQFQPETYGAKGDGKVIGDVTTNSTSTVQSPTIGAEGSAAVGKYILIHGANGPTQPAYIGHITQVSGNNVTLSGTAPAASVANCPAVYGTDDTAAVNSAAAAAGVYALANSYFAEVVFAPKIYILATGPTQVGNGSTTITYNTQVQVPHPAGASNGQKLVIALTGAGDNGYPQWWGGLVPSVSGTALVSLLTTGSSPDATFGQQSVVGGPSSAAGFTSIAGLQAFANVKVIVTGLSVWLPIYTNIYAYDFAFLSQSRVVQSSAQIFAPTGVNPSSIQPYLNNISATLAQNMVGTGFRLPIQQNNADITMEDVTAEGYGAAYRVFDHLDAGRMCSIYSIVPLVLQGAGGTGHLIAIRTLDAEAYTGGILANNGGTVQLDINMDTECAVGTVTYDVNDNGTLHGIVRFRDSADPTRVPVITGGQNLKLIWEENVPGHMASPPSVPGSGSSVAAANLPYRDAAIVVHTGVGVTVSAITLDGTVTGLTMAASSSLALPLLPSTKTVALTYAGGTPTWDWWLQ